MTQYSHSCTVWFSTRWTRNSDPANFNFTATYVISVKCIRLTPIDNILYFWISLIYSLQNFAGLVGWNKAIQFKRWSLLWNNIATVKHLFKRWSLLWNNIATVEHLFLLNCIIYHKLCIFNFRVKFAVPILNILVDGDLPEPLVVGISLIVKLSTFN